MPLHNLSGSPICSRECLSRQCNIMQGMHQKLAACLLGCKCMLHQPMACFTYQSQQASPCDSNSCGRAAQMLHSSWLTFLRASALCSLGPTSPRLSACGLSPWGALLLSRRSLRLCTCTGQSNIFCTWIYSAHIHAHAQGRAIYTSARVIYFAVRCMRG